jgi:hypothetical protein
VEKLYVQSANSCTLWKIRVYEFATYNKPFFPFLKCRINEKKVYHIVIYGKEGFFIRGKLINSYLIYWGVKNGFTVYYFRNFFSVDRFNCFNSLGDLGFWVPWISFILWVYWIPWFPCIPWILWVHWIPTVHWILWIRVCENWSNENWSTKIGRYENWAIRKLDDVKIGRKFNNKETNVFSLNGR